ncbi:heparinase II/III domain-containing protein [Nonomuraea rhodomycinica]|uniref:Heparinase II/III family protein n=1 Tax=Nonomuraea rhodomycinica TaxID=1712872 RepID=A0A7Y6IQP2_9ACTN|nr:heparinase II/III family protein [Nonomuraea rhodomycinica]NUW41319.1 heparinase II/III family protein [Nonomuraea rhodomycinica]
MTNTVTGPEPAELADRQAGPLLAVWGAAATAGALARALAPPDAALPVPGSWGRLGPHAERALRAVRERAEAERGTPWPQPLASQYTRYFRDGNRTAYEAQVFERQDRLTRAVLMALATSGETGADGRISATGQADAAGLGDEAGLASPSGLSGGVPSGSPPPPGEASMGAGAPAARTPALPPKASSSPDGGAPGDDGRPLGDSATVHDGEASGDGGEAGAGPEAAERWVDEVADGMLLLCEQTTWCWPAHEDTCRPGGPVLPDTATPYLDLGAADVAAQLAWADHVLGDRLDARYPGLRERVRREVRARVLRPFTERRDWRWLGLDGDVHNWCPWICGNVLVTALRLGEPGEERAAQVAWAVEGLDRYLAALPEDGSIDEGYEYWWNGACRALEALDVLEHATSGALAAADVPVVRATLRFPHLMWLGGPWYLNVADARARPPAGQPWHVPYRWGRRLGEADALRHALARRAGGIAVTAELGRALRELADAEWWAVDDRPAPDDRPVDQDRAGRGAGVGEAPAVAAVWFPGTQVGIAREVAAGTRGLTLAVKGGHNGEHHNHNDVGSVVVAVDGVPALVDAGRPTYTAQTFGPDRYAIWTMQSTWHNVPEIRGTAQGQGPAFRARDVEVADEPGRFEARMDLAAAYPVPGLERWRRVARLDRRAALVTVEDAWTFAAGGEPSVLHYLLAGEVERHDDGRVVVRPPDGARAALVTWDPARATAALTVRTLEDPMLSEVWGERLTRLELRLPGTARGSFELRVEVHP